MIPQTAQLRQTTPFGSFARGRLARCCGVWLLLLAGCCPSILAQPLSNLVITVGTSIQDGSQNNWSYVLLGAPESQLLAGKRFVIYGKNGYPTNSGVFTLRGSLFQQTDLGAINTLLNQSVALRDDLSSLDSALNLLLRKIPGVGTQTLAQKVSTAFQAAATDPSLAAALVVLQGLHPGLKRCAGLAFAEVITAPTTYEARELDPNTGVAGDVIGRVTIDPSAPVILPAPGFPFQVVSNGPIDHLRIRLRWGTPDALRRLSLLQFGFNLWRIPWAAAVAGGFDATPPTLAQLYGNTNFARVNTMPIMATKDYAPLVGPGGPDDPGDRVTAFFADSKGRSLGTAHFPAGQTPPGYLATPFNDGDQFYYFVTARDILGRDGLVSPGGLALACRKNPPAAPRKLSVLNFVQAVPSSGSVSNHPNLLVRWHQNTNAPDLVTQYWVYRWPNPAMAFTNDATPSNHLVGIVSQLANTDQNSLLDTSPDAPAAPGPSNFWYTVRAVSQSACGSLLFSPNSDPVSGVLRQRAAPQGATGELVGSCGTPAVMFQQFNSLPNPAGPDTNYWHYRITITRRDGGIAWAQLVVGNFASANTNFYGPLYFPPDGNSLSLDLTLPISPTSAEFDVNCQVGTYYGLVSQAAACQSTPAPAAAQITEAVFAAGELLFTALSSSDPFLAVVNHNQSFCLPAINPTRDPSGTVHMRFDAGGTPMMIQYATNSPFGQSWTDVGVAAPDANGIYSIYLCPCVISPLPPLRGCQVNLPGDGNCDQHVPRAGNSGPIAPIYVRFRLTPRTHEYRLYRSVDGSSPTLLSQDQVLYDPLNAGNEIVRTDDGMPPSAARLCYFVQLLDENGNGSPLALIGCKNLVPPKPPRPVLAQPAAAGDSSNPQVALNWFCPTSGVYRFEVRLRRADQPGSGQSSGFFNSKLLLLTALKPLQNAAPFVAPRFYGLLSDRSLVSTYDEWQLTPPVGAGFGPGPQFTLTASLIPNVPYRISVAAENVQGYWGDASAEWTFVWQPPPTIPKVPWPARVLPPVRGFDEGGYTVNFFNPLIPRVHAVLLRDANQQWDIRYPVGIRIADLSPALSVFPNIGTTNPAAVLMNPFSRSRAFVDPNNLVFKRSSTDPSLSGQPLLPIVVYRQQVTNASFPRVSGHLTQVTPLIEKLPYYTSGTVDALRVFIPDLLIASGTESYSYVFGEYGFQFSGSFLYVRDQQPVILGASYQYLVVRFDANHEVAEIIPAGTVNIPSN